MTGFLIWGRYGTADREEIDHADTRADADYLIGEYRLAYGPGWHIWATRKRAPKGGK